MTNKEAIKIISQMIKDEEGFLSDNTVEAHKMAIKALEQEPTTRNCFGCKYSKDNHNAGTEECHLCMWENQYISTIKNDLGVDKARNDSELIARGDVINMIKELPSVTPQEPRWIPVRERTPEHGGKYLLWGKIDESEEEDYCFIGDYHEFDEVFGTEISHYDSKTLGFLGTEIEEYYSVVAWRPLPTPYEPQESEDKK